MKLIYFLILLGTLVTGCKDEQKTDRDVFILGDDFHEISTHAEQQKTTPDMDMLLRVKLPPNASRSEITNYINIIYTLSRNQRTYLDSDPQVGMLAKVGRKNIDLIIQASKPGVSWVNYGIGAIGILVETEDQELILNNLRNNYELSKVILEKRWCKEAESVLVELIAAKSAGYLPSEAIECLASLKNPMHYPLLIKYMTDGWNSHITYKIIQNLPGIHLDEALQEAWEGSRANNYQIGYLTKDTLATGYMPAFHFLFETIDDNYKVPSTIYSSESLIKQFTNQTGDKTELKNWYKENKSKIKFNPSLHKYIVAES